MAELWFPLEKDFPFSPSIALLSDDLLLLRKQAARLEGVVPHFLLPARGGSKGGVLFIWASSSEDVSALEDTLGEDFPGRFFREAAVSSQTDQKLLGGVLGEAMNDLWQGLKDTPFLPATVAYLVLKEGMKRVFGEGKQPSTPPTSKDLPDWAKEVVF